MAELKHIVRIAKVDVPGGKQVRFALTKIKGVGKNLAHAVCNLAKIDNQLKAGALNEAQIKTLSDILENLKDGKVPTWMLNRRRDYDTGEDKHALIGTLDFAVENDIKRLRKIKSYKGVRHSRRLPVRGQRTKSNFRRNKGKVVGVKKKK